MSDISAVVVRSTRHALTRYRERFEPTADYPRLCQAVRDARPATRRERQEIASDRADATARVDDARGCVFVLIPLEQAEPAAAPAGLLIVTVLALAGLYATVRSDGAAKWRRIRESGRRGEWRQKRYRADRPNQ
jgi:hypothetical protein